MDTASLEVRALGVQRDGRTVLDDLTFEVPAGSSLAVTGPSGVGKTTLLDVLSGILVPDSGHVSFDGFEVSAASPRDAATWRLRHVGVVHQFAELLPELTLAENVQLPLMLSGLGAADAVARAVAALAQVGLGDLQDRFPSQVSGGERQRAAIARAVVHRPALIVADEPTGALDVGTAHIAARVLIDAASTAGATLVMATHNLEIADLLQGRLDLTHTARVTTA